MNPMRVLITGRHGQVARSLAEAAASRAEFELQFVGRPELDLADEAAIRRTVATAAPDVIVGAAAYTAVDQAETDEAAAERVNARAPGILACAAREAGARLIHLSTDYVFDGEQAEPYREDDPIAPINVYGRTKAAGEAAVRAATGDHIIIRTAWLYSPFSRNFVKTMLALAETRDSINVVDDQIGSPTAAHDIGAGLLAILDAWRRDPALGLGNTFHLAGAGTASWAEFARHVLAVSNSLGGATAEVVGVPTSAWPTPARRPRYSLLDGSKFGDTFGYRAPAWQESSTRVVARLIGTPASQVDDAQLFS